MEDILMILSKLAKLEQTMSQVYAWCSERFAADAPVRILFYNLSVEENAHYNIVKYQERVVRGAPKEFGRVSINMAAVDDALAALAAFRAGEPTVADAIQFARKMEDSLAECYAMEVMDQSNSGLAEMVRKLAETEGGEHKQRLERFIQSYEAGKG